MPNLEPTYLRYVFDSLNKGSLNAENAAALPQGFIGLYEQEFNQKTSAGERKKVLNQLALWALFKRPVSANLAADVLELEEEPIKDLVDIYSSWFNSPESGKYQLYHERLRVYLLQKLKADEIQDLNERLIARLQNAIEEQNADEFELYGLEFLTSHLYTEAMLSGVGVRLIDLAFSQNFWKRQLEISKEFSWTKNGLNEVMLWASKYSGHYVIECGLQMVDLYRQEQNAAPQIVSFVAMGDFESALKRINQFDGNDKKGLQRKFILYMLCLMELTLFDSKDKPFRKEGIVKLLRHVDKQFPIDHSVLNWNDFFSSYIVFKMGFEWTTLDIDGTVVYNRTREFFNFAKQIDFQTALSEKSKCHEYALNVKRVIDSYSNFKVPGITVNRPPHGIDEPEASFKLKDKSEKLLKKGKIRQAMQITEEIGLGRIKSLALKYISESVFNSGEKNLAFSILCRAVQCARLIRNKRDKFYVQSVLSVELSKQEMLKEAIALANEIDDEDFRVRALRDISTELCIKEKIKESRPLLFKAIESYHNFNNVSQFRSISLLLTEQGRIKDTLDIAKFIDCIKDDCDESEMNKILLIISVALTELGRADEAIKCVQGIKDVTWNLRGLKSISAQLEKLGKLKEARLVLQKALDHTGDIHEPLQKSYNQINISRQLAEQGYMDEALTLATKINEDSRRDTALMYITEELSKNGNIDRALICIDEFNNESSKIKAIENIALKLVKSGKLKRARSLFQKVIYFNNEVQNVFKIENRIRNISRQLAKQGSLDFAHSYMSQITNSNVSKDDVLCVISSEYAKRGKIDVALGYMNQITDDKRKDDALMFISIEFAKRGNVHQSSKYLNRIINLKNKNKALFNISSELAKCGNISDAEKFANELTGLSNKYKQWRKIGEIIFSSSPEINSLERSYDLKNQEAQFFYRKSWSEYLSIKQSNHDMLSASLPQFMFDVKSIHKLLYKHALHELYLTDSSQEKMHRFSHTLDIQWAIKIKNLLTH